MNLEIIDASYHRNGVCGYGFYAILFKDNDPSEDHYGRPMIASLFDEPNYCAIYSVPMLTDGNIKFAHGNSWRGDAFEHYLRPLLAKWLDDNGTNRAGPFAMPG